MQRNTKISIVFPQAEAEQVKKTAQEENKSVSDLLLEAFREYKSRKDWARIRKLGDKTAKRMGIKTY
jgi:hypothetical protein